MNLAPYAAQGLLSVIALTATALCFYILGMHHERTFQQRHMSDRRAKRLVEQRDKWMDRGVYLAEIVDRAYPDPTTRALVMNRVAADMYGSTDEWRSHLRVPPLPSKSLVDRVAPGGAYSNDTAPPEVAAR